MLDYEYSLSNTVVVFILGFNAPTTIRPYGDETLSALRISAVLFDIGNAADFLKSELSRRFFCNGVLVLLLYNSGVVRLFPGISLLLQVPPFTFGPSSKLSS